MWLMDPDENHETSVMDLSIEKEVDVVGLSDLDADKLASSSSRSSPCGELFPTQVEISEDDPSEIFTEEEIKLNSEVDTLQEQIKNYKSDQECLYRSIKEAQDKAAFMADHNNSRIEVLNFKLMETDVRLFEKDKQSRSLENYWSPIKNKKEKELEDLRKRSKVKIDNKTATVSDLRISLGNLLREKMDIEQEMLRLKALETASEASYLTAEISRLGFELANMESHITMLKIQINATREERETRRKEIDAVQKELQTMRQNKSFLTVIYSADNSSAVNSLDTNFSGTFLGGDKRLEDGDPRSDLESDWTEVVEEFRSRLNRTTDTAVLWLVSLYALVFALGVAGNGVLLRLACCSKPAVNVPKKPTRTDKQDEDTQKWRHFTAAHFLNRSNKGNMSPKNNFYSTPKRRKRNNPVLVNLCVADLLVLLVCCPMAAYTSATKVWVLGKGMCKALAYFQGVAVTSGTLSLTALSLDRYLFTRHPGVFEKVRRRRLSAGMVIGVWTLSALLSAPVILVRTTQDLRLGPFTFDFCVELWQHQMARRAFTLVTLTIVYALPCAVLIACHASVSWTLRLATGGAAVSNKEKRNKTAQKSGSNFAEEKLLSRNRIRQRAFRVKDRCEHSSGCFSSENSHSQVYPNSSYCSSGSTSARGTAFQNYSGVECNAQPSAPIAPPNSQAETSCGSRAHKRHMHYANRHYRTGTGVVVNMSSAAGDTVFSDGSCCRHSSTGTDATSNQQGNSAGDWGSNSGGGGSKNRSSFKERRTVQRSQRARRHLANVLMGMTLCFVACWLPYNAASFYVDLYPSPSLASTLPFVLLLGHAHSAVNPFVYWLLNESARRRQTSAAPEVLRSRSSLLRMHTPVYRLQAALDALLTHKTEQSSHQVSVCDSPSTTENALGVFHPRFTPNRPLPPNIRL